MRRLAQALLRVATQAVTKARVARGPRPLRHHGDFLVGGLDQDGGMPAGLGSGQQESAARALTAAIASSRLR